MTTNLDVLNTDVGDVGGTGYVLDAPEQRGSFSTYGTRGGVASEPGPEADRALAGPPRG